MLISTSPSPHHPFPSPPLLPSSHLLLPTLFSQVLVARISALPLFTQLLLRCPRCAHPARLLATLKAVEMVIIPVVFYLLRLPSTPITPLLLATGAVLGVLQSPQDSCNHMLVGWAIDEDAMRTGNRREGMFYACNGVLQHLSQVGASCQPPLIHTSTAGRESQVGASYHPPHT